MTKDTTRDKIWRQTMFRVVRGGGSITPSEIVSMVDVSEHTARDALNTMAEYDIIHRTVDDDGSVRFVPNPTFDELLVEERDLRKYK